MRALSNNYYQKSLPFADIPIHLTKLAEDDTRYNTLLKQSRITSTAGLSSSSSSSNKACDQIVNLVNAVPSPTDVSTTTRDGIDAVISVAQRVAQFSEQARKSHRTRVQPIHDSTSDSADSFALCNRQQIATISSHELPSFGGKLEYIRDDRFDSTTSVERVASDVVTVELAEQRVAPMVDGTLSSRLPWIGRLGESIRSLPANVLAVVFIGLVGGLLVSVILVIVVI